MATLDITANAHNVTIPVRGTGKPLPHHKENPYHESVRADLEAPFRA